MPTPFYHLGAAEVLLEHRGLNTAARSLISQYCPAYFLGHVASDVQVVSGQTRESTHFYNLPIAIDAELPWQKILRIYPALSAYQITDREQRVFMAGYLCHLQADWYWSGQIFEPYFGPLVTWQNFPERLYLHNVLRAYLDFHIVDHLNGEARSGLSRVQPRAWLPFVSATHLKSWQDFLAEQLKPGASIQTVDVFSARQGISAETYYRLINTEAEMQRRIFEFLPRQRLENFWDRLIDANLALLNEYLTRVEGVTDADS